MELKSNIEELITKSGLQKKFIANKLGVSVKQLRNYETGHSYIPIDKAYILVRLLDNKVKVDDLYEVVNDVIE
jgi:transcriptional regulator with XRE-family HTH domain